MASNVESVFEFMALIGKLKRLRRTGWVLRGVTEPESDADHMYRVAMTAFLAPPPLDADRCVKMALVHDMAECIVGDLTPHDNVSKEEKHQREDICDNLRNSGWRICTGKPYTYTTFVGSLYEAVMFLADASKPTHVHYMQEATRHMCSLVGEPLGSHLYSLWQEYEDQETEESKFVKDLDRFDMVLQAYEYEQQEQRPGFLQEFFDSTKGKFQTQTVKDWRLHLDSTRQGSIPEPPSLQTSQDTDSSTTVTSSATLSRMQSSDACNLTGHGDEKNDGAEDTDDVKKRKLCD